MLLFNDFNDSGFPENDIDGLFCHQAWGGVKKKEQARAIIVIDG